MDFAKCYDNEATVKIEDTEITLINPFKSPAYQAEVLKEQKDGLISDEKTRELVADFIIKGWNNLHFGKDKKGNLKEVEYSKDAAKKLMNVSEIFRESVFNLAFNRKTFESALGSDLLGDLGN
jgi:hypothetical protein